MATRESLPVLVPAPARMASTAATTLAIGAVACGVCCALPFALPAVVLASTGGLIAFLAQASWWALYLATVMVAGAWLWVARDLKRTGKRPARSTVLTMSLATIALAAAMLWPLVGARVIGAFQGAIP